MKKDVYGDGVLLKILPIISPASGAMLRTTLAFTMAKGADGFNVLPQEAYVTGNMRFIQHQPNKESLECVKILHLAVYPMGVYNIENEVIIWKNKKIVIAIRKRNVPNRNIKNCITD